MIKCPNCGSDNQLGVVHCSGCGKVLEINDLRPEVEIEEDSSILVKYVVKRTIILIFLIVLGVPAIGALLPATVEEPDLEVENEKAIKALKSITGRKGSQVFTAEEVELYLNKVISESSEEAGIVTFTPEAVALSFDEDGFKLVLKSVILGDKYSIYTTLDATIEVSEGGIEVKPKEAKLGMTPVPASMATYLTASLEELLNQYEQISQLTEVVSAIKFEKDKVMISTKKKK